MITIYPNNFIDVKRHEKINVKIYENREFKDASAFLNEFADTTWIAFSEFYEVSSKRFRIGDVNDPVFCQFFEVHNAKGYDFVGVATILEVSNTIFFKDFTDMFYFIDEMESRIKFINDSMGEEKLYNFVLKKDNESAK